MVSPALVERAAAPIALLPLGEIGFAPLRLLERILDETLAAPSVVLPAASLPELAFAPTRDQYDADLILDDLFAQLPERCLRLIALADADLFVRGRTFVFGYGHLTDGIAVVSLTRMRESFHHRAERPEPLEARLRRTVLHELGHTFGAPHCARTICVMRPVTQIDSLDALGDRFCGGCRRRVVEGLSIAPWSPRGRFERHLAIRRRRLVAL
jgi:archaemetzincin